METTTIEVKFSASDIQEDAKRTALQAYEENNFTLGLFFANAPPAEPHLTSPAPASALDFPPCRVSLEQLEEMNATFENARNALRSGQLEHGIKIAEPAGLIDLKSPLLTFLPSRAEKTVAEVKQNGSILPWTSGDSITIIPL
jgi:hypothetical protein